MEINDFYKEFLGEIVNIGIPHYYKKNRLFYLTGLVINNKDDFLTLKIKDGMRKIPFTDIIEISINKREGEGREV